MIHDSPRLRADLPATTPVTMPADDPGAIYRRNSGDSTHVTLKTAPGDRSAARDAVARQLSTAFTPDAADPDLADLACRNMHQEIEGPGWLAPMQTADDFMAWRLPVVPECGVFAEPATADVAQSDGPGFDAQPVREPMPEIPPFAGFARKMAHSEPLPEVPECLSDLVERLNLLPQNAILRVDEDRMLNPHQPAKSVGGFLKSVFSGPSTSERALQKKTRDFVLGALMDQRNSIDLRPGKRLTSESNTILEIERCVAKLEKQRDIHVYQVKAVFNLALKEAQLYAARNQGRGQASA